MGDNVTLARDGAIATVTLNRPERRNSLSDPMLTELAAAFAELRDDAATRVVIVTGAPPVFSAGADARLKSAHVGRGAARGLRPARRASSAGSSSAPMACSRASSRRPSR